MVLRLEKELLKTPTTRRKSAGFANVRIEDFCTTKDATHRANTEARRHKMPPKAGHRHGRQECWKERPGLGWGGRIPTRLGCGPLFGGHGNLLETKQTQHLPELLQKLTGLPSPFTSPSYPLPYCSQSDL